MPEVSKRANRKQPRLVCLEFHQYFYLLRRQPRLVTLIARIVQWCACKGEPLAHIGYSILLCYRRRRRRRCHRYEFWWFSGRSMAGVHRRWAVREIQAHSVLPPVDVRCKHYGGEPETVAGCDMATCSTICFEVAKTI